MENPLYIPLRPRHTFSDACAPVSHTAAHVHPKWGTVTHLDCGQWGEISILLGEKISILLVKNKFSKPFPPMERTFLYSFIQQMFLSTYEIVRAWRSCSATSECLPRHCRDFHKSAGQSLLLER